jgi:hypothetical protein
MKGRFAQRHYRIEGTTHLVAAQVDCGENEGFQTRCSSLTSNDEISAAFATIRAARALDAACGAIRGRESTRGTIILSEQISMGGRETVVLCMPTCQRLSIIRPNSCQTDWPNSLIRRSWGTHQ